MHPGHMTGVPSLVSITLKNAVGIELPSQRRKDAKKKHEFEQNEYDLCLHQTGEDIDHLVFDSDLCFSWRLCALAVEV